MPNAKKKQFVIAEHITSDNVHWDLMLEMEDILWTWRINTTPSEIKIEAIGAERIHDHPLRFLSYEGPVQNNTGQVKITDKGTYILRKQTDIELTLELHGNILNGSCTLSKNQYTNLWTLRF